MKRSVTLILVALLAISCDNQNKIIEYLTTFAKAYGYVKYFHPSDEAFAIDWAQFASYGANEISKCKNKEDLINTLNHLFKPIAPTVKFADENLVTDYNFNQIRPENLSNYCLTYWQHIGVGFGMVLHPSSPYKSERALINCESDEKLLFDYKPNEEELISKSIGSGVHCQIPLVLYRNENGTFPNADKNSFNDLKSKIIYSGIGLHNLSVRLGNIINTFNVFQHFYPYSDVVAVSWELEMRKALQRSFSDKNGNDHILTLEKFTAHLKDGHITISGSSTNSYRPKIMWEWIEDRLVITRVLDKEIDLQVGDVVTHINGVKAHKYFDEVKSRISAATKGWLNYKAEYYSLLGPENSTITVRVNGKNTDLTRDLNYYPSRQLFKNSVKEYEMIDDNTVYLNLDVISISKINELLPTLEECKTIICDLRGYPNANDKLITHFLQSDDTTQAWMQIPLIAYPDMERVVGFNKYDWTKYMNAKEPYLGDKKIIFIIDGRAISYAESVLGYIEGYDLATIIGQPSAGTNGNVNHFKLSGGIEIYFTGMKVLKHDGSQHHGIGILPDVYVEKTVKGVKEGRDEFLEKAIEIAMNE
ncbi:MAG: S41 family peptidase [Tenuifilaceae bacterium]|jgi:hypothetical protein|nr:S41 family peptidase [Tenuifilaceae bacterium]